jgi:hypothetical protein
MGSCLLLSFGFLTSLGGCDNSGPAVSPQVQAQQDEAIRQQMENADKASKNAAGAAK